MMFNLADLLIRLLILSTLGAGGIAGLHVIEQTMKNLAIEAHEKGFMKIGQFQRRLNSGK